MNPTTLMSVEQVKEYFSMTHEFQVTDAGKNLNISYTDSGKTTSSLIWKEHINIQQLIRKTTQLLYNFHHNILD